MPPWKPVINNCPSFRPVLDGINTTSYELAKFLEPINEYTVKDFFGFAKEMTKTDIDCNYVSDSLGVKAFLPIYLYKKRLKLVLMICFLINLKLII